MNLEVMNINTNRDEVTKKKKNNKLTNNVK